MNRSDTEQNPDQAAGAEGADQVLRYRSGAESVVVTQHETPGHDAYGPESAEVETVGSPASPNESDPLDHADRAVMTPGQPGSLAEQRTLTDDDGDDIREYTGEPVETDEGWVIPQAQNRGPVPDDPPSR